MSGGGIRAVVCLWNMLPVSSRIWEGLHACVWRAWRLRLDMYACVRVRFCVAACLIIWDREGPLIRDVRFCVPSRPRHIQSRWVTRNGRGSPATRRDETSCPVVLLVLVLWGEVSITGSVWKQACCQLCCSGLKPRSLDGSWWRLRDGGNAGEATGEERNRERERGGIHIWRS